MDQDIRDIKGPGFLPFELESWMWALIALVLIGTGLLLYLFFRKKEEVVEEVVLLSPDQEALQALAILTKKEYPKEGAFKTYFFELSAILRLYLERRFNLPITDKTTEEFLNDSAIKVFLNQSQQKTLQLFLMQSDLIKFAKQDSSIKECDEAEHFLKQLIQETL